MKPNALIAIAGFSARKPDEVLRLGRALPVFIAPENLSLTIQQITLPETAVHSAITAPARPPNLTSVQRDVMDLKKVCQCVCYQSP